MRRNYRKYSRINTEQYSKRIKSSFWSLVSISVGLLFTYLALTNPVNNDDIDIENSKTEEEISYQYVNIKKDITPPMKENKNKDKNEKHIER